MNCGECEKCVRTMLALVALGVLKKATAFSKNNVTEELVDSAVDLEPNIVPLYRQLLEPLAEMGRHDLVRAVERKIADFYHDQKKEKWRKKTIQPVVEFDKKFLKGNLKKLKNLAFDQKTMK